MIINYLNENIDKAAKANWSEKEKKALLHNVQIYFQSPLKLLFRDNVYIKKISAELSYYLSMIFTEVEVNCCDVKAFLDDSIKVGEKSLDILPPANLNFEFKLAHTENWDYSKFYLITRELTKSKWMKFFEHNKSLINMNSCNSSSLGICHSILKQSKPILQFPFNELPARLFDDKNITGINSVIEDSIEGPIFEKLNDNEFLEPIYKKIIKYLDELFLNMLDE